MTGTLIATEPEVQAPPPMAGRPVRKGQRAETRAAWLFIAPDLAGLALFVMLPIVLALGVSFLRFDGFGGFAFIGLDNFTRMWNDPLLPNSLLVTVVYAVAYVALVFVAGLALALLVQKPFPGYGMVRTLLFLPNVMSLVVVAVIWQFLLVDKTGFIPMLTRGIGLGSVSWLGNPELVLGTLVIVSIWFQAGYVMLLFLGGLADIPEEYYEAARIDGAGAFQRLVSITLPLLRPTSFFILVTSVIAAVTGVQAFDLAFVLTGGGPANATSTLPLYIYQQAFQYGDYGYAAALTTILVIALVISVGLMFKLTKGAKFHEA